MSSLLWSLGRWAVRRRRFVVVGWLVLIAVIGGLGMTFNQGLNNDVTIPGTESTIAMGRLAATFPQSVESSAQVLVVVPKGETIKGTPAVQQAIEQSIKRFEKLDQVDTVTSPYQSTAGASINKAGDATILTVNMNAQSVSITDQTKDQLQSETDRLGAALPKGSEASLGGTLFADEFPTLGASEGGGLVLALVILVITLGSLVAAGLPLLNAVAGVGVTMGLVYLSTNLFTVNATTPLLAIMLGLAVGLDYSLFITSRHRDQLAAGADPAESVATAVATGGSAVVFAGSTVIIALLGLSVAGIGFLTVMGAAAALGVFLAVAASLTLLPALLGMCGQRLRPRRARRVTAGERRAATVQAKAQAKAQAKNDRRESRRQTAPDAGRPVSRSAAHSASSPATAPADAEPRTRGQRFFAGWVRTVTRRPAITIAAVVVVLLFVAWPALGLRLCLPDAGQMPKGSGARVTYDRIAEEFGEGFNGPLIVEGSIVTSNDPITLMNQIGAEIKKLPGVADVPLATPNQTGDTGIVQVIPEGGPDSVQTENLVKEIRADRAHFLAKYGVDLKVTGITAVGIDVSQKLGAALLPFGIVVVGLSLILMAMVFRSIWVPVKATLGYLLSVLAALGVVTGVFGKGWAASFFGVAKLGPVISFLPIILMGVLFGLAMDYEVFLVSRMREEYVRLGGRGTPGAGRRAVQIGFRHSAKVVTAAALIMMGVFASFIPGGSQIIKPIALGLTVGVGVDAFIVRMTLVPAVMTLLGDHAWWMPRVLDRVLPRFDIEGAALLHERSLAAWPAEGAGGALAARGVSVTGAGGEPLLAPASVLLGAGGRLVVAGQELAGVSAFLLAATGRLATDAGDLKTLGLVLPERASKVRRRAAYLDAAQLDGATAEAVEGAVHDGVRLIALDHTETLADSGLRGRVRRELAAAGARGVAVVLGAVGDAAALGEAEALLDGPARVLELAPAAGDPDGTAGVTSPGAARKTGRSASDASGPAHHTSSDDSKKRVLA